MTHTKGKWQRDGASVIIFNEKSKEYNEIASCYSPHLDELGQIANAERIVECANRWDELQAENAKLREALQYYEDGVGHFYDCINFGSSNLSAKAIDYMNTVGIKIKQALK